ncbi:hypothetical protein CS022_05930 [Veronia nyctiphanis]|uniref:Lipoprotein n=1 Tax=Veronia nyctiphanis TaxID=1278244 RepID=A0A4Q0YTT5_9GAMM|nr:hypothetical protein [Veronia nyctiphanis]RXJ74155.1 hypothetical protein CS022_05930 [Veronia nyctiphanis]
MKKPLSIVALIVALAGCEDANKMIDQAQQVANDAVDTVQAKMETVDLSGLNLDHLTDASESAASLLISVENIMNTDFGNPADLLNTTNDIANSYSCLVEVSSESTADQVINSIVSNISNPDIIALIDKGIEKAKEVEVCVR